MKIKFIYTFMCFHIVTMVFCNFKSDLNKANKLFYDKKYDEALEKYNSAEIKNPNSAILYYNRGNNYYKQYNHQQAINEYQKSLGLTKNKNLKSKILYNMGNAYLKMGDTQKAKEAYLKGLSLNPKDEDIKYNLQYALINLNMQQQKTKPDDKKKDNQQNNKEQQKQQSQEQQKYMSEQDVQRLIESVGQQQKDKLKEALKQQKPKLPPVDKDW